MEKEYLELKKFYKELGKDNDKLQDKLQEKELLIYSLKTQIELLEEEKIVYEDRIKNLILSVEDFKTAYFLLKKEYLELLMNIIYNE